jgi:DMSO/TMAO reductase YedYZ molybdopterin-dependent catalytic subunit
MKKLIDHPASGDVERRLFLRQSLSLGALVMLTGCDLSDDDSIDRALRSMSRWNDRVQEAIFDPRRMAPIYSVEAITRPFPFNGIYSEDDPPYVDTARYRLELVGLIAERRPWTLGELQRLPQVAQITRHICIEGWSAIGQWNGVPLHVFLRLVGADLRARYVGVRCADGYYSSLDMASALHPQTILAFDQMNAPLSPKFGAPLRLRVPTKLGFKSAKHIMTLFVTNRDPGGYWEDQGYNWFSGT